MADEMVGMTGSFSVDTSGIDSAATRVVSAAEKITRALKDTKTATDQTKASSSGVAVAFGTLNGSANAWAKAIQEGSDKAKASIASQKAYEKSLGDMLVPIQKLQVEGLKYQETLRKNAQAAEQAATRTAAAAAKQASRGPSGGSFVPLHQLQMDGLKFKENADKGASGATNLATKLMVLSQVADDAQYGFRAIVNQIPMAVMAFGGTAGLAGGVALAGVAVNQLINRWDTLKDALGTTVIKNAADEIAQLERATSRTADQAERLERLKNTQATAEAQRTAKTPEEERVAQEIGEGMKEIKYEDLINATKKALVRSGKFTDQGVTDREVEEVAAPEREAALRASRGAHGLDAGRKAEIRKKLEKDREARLTEAATSAVAEAQTGKGEVGVNARKNLASILAGTTEGQMYEAQTPEGRARRLQAQMDIESLQGQEAYRQELLEKDYNKSARDAEDQSKIAAGGDQTHKEATGMVKDMQAANQARMDRNDEANDAFFKDRTLEEKDNDLRWRLRGIVMRGATESKSYGDLDSYENSIKATSAEAQLRKMHDIHEVLKEIKKNTGERKTLAQRIVR